MDNIVNLLMADLVGDSEGGCQSYVLIEATASVGLTHAFHRGQA